MTHRSFVVAVAALIAVLLVGTSVFAAAVDAVGSSSGSTDTSPTVATSSGFGTDVSDGGLAAALTPWQTCLLFFIGYPTGLTVGGPACALLLSEHSPNLVSADEAVAATNLMTTLYNYLNITNAETASLNGTFQELLSYYEDRAEAIVPEFLNGAWNETVYDEIAIQSGLVPSIEGLETAVAEQEYQDWNATAAGWNLAFGSGGTYSSAAGEFEETYNIDGEQVNATISAVGGDLSVSNPWEVWYYPAVKPLYFNMAAGGTIVTTNLTNVSDEGPMGQYIVYDLTKGTSFLVPQVSYADWEENDVPVESTLQGIGQFDLLKLVCEADCGNAVSSYVETSGAYAFENASTDLSGGPLTTNSMVPFLKVFQPTSPYAFYVASPNGACIGLGTSGPSEPCYTQNVPSGGVSGALGSGPSAVVGGNRTLYAFAPTFQRIVNNTMTMAYDYWQTLRVVTENGTYAIPSTCAIPTPSDAFPSATDYADYLLSPNDVEAVYLAYLNAVAREYGQVFTTGTDFCGDPDLGFSFNWSGSWRLALNVTASVYLSNGTVAVYPNGTRDPTEVYADPSTWPVEQVFPSLLYPEEYQMDIPVGEVYPVPVNDPMEAVLVNYSGNLYYGSGSFSPPWGIPTWTSLAGDGPYINVTGQLTSTPSGSPVADGDAVYVDSCVLDGVAENPCDISVTYFNYFALGIVHAILPPPSSGGLGGLTLGGNACGTASFTSWYDAWAGDVVSGVASVFVYVGNGLANVPFLGPALQGFFTTLGCVLGWLVLIIVVIVLIWVVVKVVEFYRGESGGFHLPRRRSSGTSSPSNTTNVTVNLDDD